MTSVVFLHAFPCDHRMWRAQQLAVEAAGWPAVSLDLPGFGSVPLPKAAPDLDVVADDVVHRLRRTDDGPWLIVGVSLGGYVAMNMVRRHLDVVAGVALCDTKATADTGAARENRYRLAAMVDESPQECARILEQAVLAGLLGSTSRHHRPAVVERVVQWLHEADPRAVAWYQRGMAKRPDSRTVLAQFTRPAAVIWGSEDTLSPWAEQEMLLEALPQAQLTTIQGAGHLANVECPDEVSTALVQFVSSSMQ